MVVNWQHSLSTAVNHHMIRAYGCGNGHLTYETSFDIDENQHRFKRDQYAKTVGAEIWKNCIFFFKIPATTVSAYWSLLNLY